MLQGCSVAGHRGLGEITFFNQLLFGLGATTLSCVFNGPFSECRCCITLQSRPNIDLADAVVKELGNLIVRYGDLLRKVK